jgi:hypothetical protein
MRNHKLTNGRPKEIKCIPLGNGQFTTNPTEQQLIAFGCKEWIRPEPQPNCEEIFTENETQIISTWVEIPIVQPIWHEETNFQIKFTYKQLSTMYELTQSMTDYFSLCQPYEDMMGNCLYYIDEITDEDRITIEYFGGIIYDKN